MSESTVEHPEATEGREEDPGRPSNAPAVLSAIVFGVAILLFLINVCRHWTYLEDDPLIVFRYAQNFHDGHRWVMNPGERVDGCTSWFGLLLVTFLTEYLSLDATVVALKLLGVVCGLIILWRARQIAEILLPEAPALASVAALLIAYRTDFALSMINALETPYACAFLLSALIALNQADRDKSPEWKAMVLFALAGLCRPELCVLYPILVIVRTVRGRRSGFVELGVYCVPFLLVALFSFLYYHSLVPNTYYAKRVGLAEGFFLGGGYIAQYLRAPISALPGVASLACLVAVAARRNQFNAVFFLTIGIYLLFLLRTSGDWMVEGRFAMPLLPLAAASWVIGAYALAGLIASVVQQRNRMVVLALSAVAVALVFYVLLDDNRQRDAFIAQYSRSKALGTVQASGAPLSGWMCGAPDGRIRVANWIAANVAPGKLVAMPEMGLITCLNPRINFIDFEGLTDATIARLPGLLHTPYGVHAGPYWDDLTTGVGQYIEARHADYVISIWGSSLQSRNPHYRRIAIVRAYADNSGWHDFAIYKRTVAKTVSTKS